MRARLVAMGALVALAGCAEIKDTSGPPVTATDPGPGVNPLRQESARITEQSQGLTGPPVTFGNTTGGRNPTRSAIDYTGPGQGSIEAPAADRPVDPRIGRGRQ